MPLLASAAVALALLLGAGASWAMQAGLTYPCPFKYLFALPCPTCGATRSLASLARLDLLEALRFNPLLVIGSSAAAAGWLLHRKFHWISRFALPAFIAAFLLNWVYLLIYLPR